MKIEALNQHIPNTAEARVSVGCGLDGDEGNECAFHYTINADGLKIYRETDDGTPVGGLDLNNPDLDCLCGVPTADAPSPELRRSVFNIVERELGYGSRLYTGTAAKEELLKCLGEVWNSGAEGTAWVLSTHRASWSELGFQDVAGAESSAAVMVDGLDKRHEGLTWKYTYYPWNGVGLYLVQP